MKQDFSVLHPNPGWLNSDDLSCEVKSENSQHLLGKHCILELHDCNQFKLNDEAFVRTTITTAVKVSGAKLLNLATHKFKPQGVTALALLAESHLSIHTWPESKYAAVDVFTCGDHTMPIQACDFLYKEFESERYSLKNLQRQTSIQLSHDFREAG
tara:strand:+ start:618 stop:1085 length:468 start_codon:yes stop_codon:yes gene_type:complete